MKNTNPFIIGRYENSTFFCDRESETARLMESFINQRNITIISPRRLGKTGLILHFFDRVNKQKEASTIYIDLMHTQNLDQFIKLFAREVIGKFDTKTTKLLATFSNTVRSLRPGITIDPMTGQPTIEIRLEPDSDRETSIGEIFSYLSKLNNRIIIAFDEFQQIGNYPEKGIEALLRSHIQQTINTTFIYSGSRKHLLLNMFSEYSRPFYQSSEIMNLDKIDRNVYHEFIADMFGFGKRVIDPLAVNMILDLTDNHTWYVQYLCNKIYGLNEKKIDTSLVIATLINILKEQEVVYYNYRNLLTQLQFDLLKAFAQEGVVKMPTSKDFLQKYSLSAASSVKTSLDSLIDKEMILEEPYGYRVYDIFFAQWLKRL